MVLGPAIRIEVVPPVFFLVLFAGLFAGCGFAGGGFVSLRQFSRRARSDCTEARGQFRGRYRFSPYFRDYQRERIMTFVALRGDRSARNGERLECHPTAQQAVGTGGLTGKGWREGLQAPLGATCRAPGRAQ